ncbi:MAG: HEAT repeat domain-containing protein, partial [Pirellulaceae bacterium]|nr:HEAT repeat domain-containing protein [Pirellulaceae bacterium]
MILLILLLAQPASAVDPAVTLEPAVREKCLAVLKAGLRSDEFWPAMHAAEALTYAGEKALVIQELNAKAATDDQQRCGLARESIRAGVRDLAGILLAILDDPKSIGRVHAAESLFKVAEIGDGQALRAAAAQEADLKLKLMAAAALARLGDKDSLALIRKCVLHRDRETRKVAVWILGQIGEPSDVPAIREALKNEDDELARAYCANALACLGDQAGLELLQKNLSSGNPVVRTYAADFAGHAKAIQTHGRLIEL